MQPAEPEIFPRIRVRMGDVIVLGPGKADLLEAVQRHGTIKDAASSLAMSYMRAWGLIRTMNEAFVEPLVITTRGGSGKGAAHLSQTGEHVLRIYREMERDANRSIRRRWRQLQALVAR